MYFYGPIGIDGAWSWSRLRMWSSSRRISIHGTHGIAWMKSESTI